MHVSSGHADFVRQGINLYIQFWKNIFQSKIAFIKDSFYLIVFFYGSLVWLPINLPFAENRVALFPDVPKSCAKMYDSI